MFKKYFSLNLTILLLFFLDRVVKFYFIKNPAETFGGDFFSSLLTFNLATNEGIAFGINMDQAILIGLVIVTIFILFNFLSKAYQDGNLINIFSLTLIIVGAISNLIDRLRWGFVIDYIDIPWFTVFNLADAMITIGAVILIVDIFFDKNKRTSLS